MDLSFVLLAALQSILSVCIIYVAGAALAWLGVITQPSVEAMSRLSQCLLIPCISFTVLGGNLNVEVFRETWILAVAGMAMVCVNFAFAQLLVPIGRPDPSFHPWFVLSITFPNNVAIPLVLSRALCAQEEPGAPEACFRTASTRVFTFSLFFLAMLWLGAFNYAKAYIKTESNLPLVASDAKLDSISSGSPDSSTAGDERPAEANVAGIESPEVTKDDKCDQSVVLSEVPEMNPDCAVPSKKLSREKSLPSVSTLANITDQLKKAFANPPVIGSFFGMFVGLCGPVKALFFSEHAPLQAVASATAVIADAVVPLMNIVMAASLGLKLKSLRGKSNVLSESSLGISWRTLLTMFVGRMLVLPLIFLGLLVAGLDFLPEDRWLRLVLFMEPVAPTANMIIVIAHCLKQKEAAESMALSIIPQFLLFPFTATASIALGLVMVPGV